MGVLGSGLGARASKQRLERGCREAGQKAAQVRVGGGQGSGDGGQGPPGLEFGDSTDRASLSLSLAREGLGLPRGEALVGVRPLGWLAPTARTPSATLTQPDPRVSRALLQPRWKFPRVQRGAVRGGLRVTAGVPVLANPIWDPTSPPCIQASKPSSTDTPNPDCSPRRARALFRRTCCSWARTPGR